MAEHDMDAAFYAARVTAWFGTRLEHDKSLLTLSAGGIGLLITLLSTTGLKSIESLLLYILALTSFVGCLGCVLWIFKRNAIHLEKVNLGHGDQDPVLTILDTVAIASFGLGVLLSSVVGIAAGIHSFQKQEISMSIEDKGNRQTFSDSFDRVTNMQPQAPLKRSFNNAASMKPDSSEPAPQQATTPVTPPPSTDSTTKKP
jgi:hypothetical protein